MDQLSYRRHRFPPPIIQHAIWLYLRFTLSYREVEELLAERPRSRPRPNCFAIVDRRSLYAGATIAWSCGKCQRARYRSTVSP
jgi:hypothetical protein